MHILGSYIKTINVMDIQTEPTVVEESSSIYDGIITMFTKNAGTLYVVDGKYLPGLCPEKILLKPWLEEKR